MTGASSTAVRIRTIDEFGANRQAEALVWWNGARSTMFREKDILNEVEAARRRFERFAPVLTRLFRQETWDGAITSPLIPLSMEEAAGPVWVKCDHALPIAGSVKARGGIHEVLKYVEQLARHRGIDPGEAAFADRLLEPATQAWMAKHHLLVGSTGNLAYGVGVAARAFGLQVEVHMSNDAKEWKKERLRAFGVSVVEHPGDFSEAVAEARRSASIRPDCHFVDDENSLDLLVGYAVAARELALQLDSASVQPSSSNPMAVYIPCGVGGAAGGIALGLKAIFGEAVLTIFVEPVASACMMAARLNGDRSVPVYAHGFDNRTIADGLAVPCASQLVLNVAGPFLDAAVAVPDAAMVEWARRMWVDAGLRLEPSAAAGFAARRYIRSVAGDAIRDMTELVWTTGGHLMPDHEFDALQGR